MNRSLYLLLFAALIWVCSAPNLFAQIVLEATYPGKSALGCCSPWGDFKADFDLNGDGIPDQPLMEEEGIYYFLTVIDGANPEILLFDGKGNDLPTEEIVFVVGFYELEPDNDHKEIVLAEKKGRRYVNPMVIDVDGNLLWDGSGKVLLGVAQMDGDVCEEIVAADPTVPQVEVHGKEEDSTRTALKWHR